MTLIVEESPKSPISEAYRTLRTNIQFSSFENDIKTILVTSSGPSEGKSTTAGNLALTFAESGKRVLLIDSDLRRPSLHKKFFISNQRGLSNLLAEDLKLEDVAQKHLDNLYILTSGIIPPDPSEMLSSKKMKAFMEDTNNKFDYIIIDTPPIIAVTDAQILSTMVDGVILVISAGHTERQAVKKAKELLLNVRAKVLGVVLNKLDLTFKRSYGYYYYGNDNERSGGK